MFARFEDNPKKLMLKRGNSSMSSISLHSIVSAGGCQPGRASNGNSKQLNTSFAGGILLGEKEIWRIFADMARSVQHVHDKGFIHLDIKPSNFFVAKDRSVKLGDFGKAIHVDAVANVIDSDVEGDAIYMAPELL
mmetsp:Transcript_16095/g.20427  ORF Transcript_16095/g.20427 Transcript_16095/m.20427 type:complete len:135 (-) Transcript_16095:1700-2104(-)